jgi:hypothetical protein
MAEEKKYYERFTEAELIASMEKFGKGEPCDQIEPNNYQKTSLTPEQLTEFEESFQAWGATRQKVS